MSVRKVRVVLEIDVDLEARALQTPGWTEDAMSDFDAMRFDYGLNGESRFQPYKVRECRAVPVNTYLLPNGQEVKVYEGQFVRCTPNSRNASAFNLPEQFITQVNLLREDMPRDEQGRYVPSVVQYICQTERGWGVLPEELSNTDPRRCTSEFL